MRYIKPWLGVSLVVLLLAGGVAYGAPLLLSGEQLQQRLGEAGLRLVDVRPPPQYAAGHLPGAVNLPLAAITQQRGGTPGMLAPLSVVEQALGARGIDRTHWVVIYDEVGGDRATRLFWVLDYLGQARLSVLDGGFALWQQEGRPLSQEVPQVAATRYQATPDASKLADLAWVRAHLDDPGVVLVDARSPAEFSGQQPGRQVVRGGHIPGAVNLNWVEHLTPPPHRLKAREELARLYRRLGVVPQKEVVVYCRTGVRASHTYFVLRLLGYPRVRLYDGSFVEWAAEATAPVAR
ncbi:MAG: hypothetical protein KatS3mg131_1398 [Candidatus Tectimicrobiota bacterium]|nr:MAG: hypothetical protein KatS3mg131_1398 [Candidatus Tectomicrobia bacterium]